MIIHKKALLNRVFSLVCCMVLSGALLVAAQPAIDVAQDSDVTPPMTYTFAYPSVRSSEKKLEANTLLSKYDRAIRIQINVEDINLYTILGKMQYTLKDMLDDAMAQQPRTDDVANEIVALQYVYDTIDLERITLESIIHDINTNTFLPKLEFEGAFLNICNSLRRVKRLEPRHLRELSQAIEKFNGQLMNYYFNRKEFLSAREITAFNKLISFNTVLIEQILLADYFDFTTGDYLIDTIYYRPKAFILRNKTAVALGCVALVAGAVAWYYWHRSSATQSEPPIAVEPVDCLRQTENSCGTHSIINALVLNGLGGNVKAAAAARLSQAEFDQLRSKLAPTFTKYNIDPTGEDVENVQLSQLLADKDFLTAVQDFYRETKKVTLAINPENIAVVTKPSSFDVKAFLDCLKSAQLLPDHDAKTAVSIAAFRTSKAPQTVILYQGPAAQGGYGHWIAVHLAADDQSPQQAKVYVADSGGHAQAYARSHSLHDLLKLYTKGEILLPHVSDSLNKFVDAYNRCKPENAIGSNGSTVQPDVAAKSAIALLMQGVKGLVTKNPDFMTRIDIPLQRAYCAEMFEKVLAYWQAQGLTEPTPVEKRALSRNAVLGDEQFNPATIKTFEAFVAWVQSLTWQE